jgi:hypothetical protein
MSDWDHGGYNIPNYGQIATIENMTQLAGALLAMNNINGDQWQDLRDGIYKYITKALHHRGLEDQTPTVSDISPEIFAYCCGYTEAHQALLHRFEKSNPALFELYKSGSL